jgi:(p)ppGpp synthase/HD superfamily hydrolase
MGNNEVTTVRFGWALQYADDQHKDDLRKAEPDDPLPGAPYISHPLAVASLVLEYGGSEDEAIGALLHDVAEDHGGEAALADIRRHFGDEVAAIVRGCSDSLLAEGKEKEDWETRKRRYIASLEVKALDALLVSCADKLHNARSILRDHRMLGDAVYGRFKPGKVSLEHGREKTLWYYQSLTAVYQRRLKSVGGAELAKELQLTVDELEQRPSEPDPAPAE